MVGRGEPPNFRQANRKAWTVSRDARESLTAFAVPFLFRVLLKMRSLYGRLHRRYGKKITGAERQAFVAEKRAPQERKPPAAIETMRLALDVTARPRVAIVGGGLAGLMAACELVDYCDVTVCEARDRFGAVRILVDSRRGTVVPPDLIAPLSRTRDGLVQDDDRIAGLVETSVRKLEVRNTVGNPKWQFFLSETAARTWLTAMDHIVAKAS